MYDASIIYKINENLPKLNLLRAMVLNDGQTEWLLWRGPNEISIFSLPPCGKNCAYISLNVSSLTMPVGHSCREKALSLKQTYLDI